MESLMESLNDGGLLYYQTFSGSRINDRGPSNPDFRLTEGELLNCFGKHSVLYYREDQNQNRLDDTLNDQAMIIVRKKT
jgi:hypothetical protein